ncbi:hypothetical protein BDA99DRAFT_532843 [Phascolomyces articulosus]|uniref:Uncharacterized protein n=1 Tax=Phascolomyces articulosus TaxID=60185 RepID=A0AAD5KNF7_9FUNG|nr:hypothetical protein BDA99DRAFT_532843 [Phascolomyces articulosus]
MALSNPGRSSAFWLRDRFQTSVPKTSKAGELKMLLNKSQNLKVEVIDHKNIENCNNHRVAFSGSVNKQVSTATLSPYVNNELFIDGFLTEKSVFEQVSLVFINHPHHQHINKDTSALGGGGSICVVKCNNIQDPVSRVASSGLYTKLPLLHLMCINAIP